MDGFGNFATFLAQAEKLMTWHVLLPAHRHVLTLGIGASDIDMKRTSWLSGLEV